MDHTQYTTNGAERKPGTHLTMEDRGAIQAMKKLGHSNRAIARYLHCAPSTISNELKRGTPPRTGSRGRAPGYSAKRGDAVYKENRKNSHKPHRIDKCTSFVQWVVTQVRTEKWSIDACVGYARKNKLFPEEKISEEWSSYVCLSVTDTGCGMDKETMQHIFEPFFTTKKTGEGTGLGLALADQIIRTHRGRIRAESTIGRGTTFYVYLPVLEQQQEREQLQWGVDSKLRILAADDNNKVLDLLDKDLSALGLSVSTCSRRGELRQLLEQQPFDVLAIDESLMSSSGVDFCMAIRGRYPGMTRIVMTNAPTREIVDARSHGVIDGYVVKPVSASTLLAQIRSSRKE